MLTRRPLTAAVLLLALCTFLSQSGCSWSYEIWQPQQPETSFDGPEYEQEETLPRCERWPAAVDTVGGGLSLAASIGLSLTWTITNLLISHNSTIDGSGKVEPFSFALLLAASASIIAHENYVSSAITGWTKWAKCMAERDRIFALRTIRARQQLENKSHVIHETSDQVPCPACGADCIAEGLVKTLLAYRVQIQKMCPEGCLPLDWVKDLSDDPDCLHSNREIYDQTGPPERRVETTKNRLSIMPTAQGTPAGQFLAVGHMGLVWHLEYAINDNLQIGAIMPLPIFMLFFMPTLKTQVQVHNNLALGAGIIGGIGTFFESGEQAGYYLGAGAHVTGTAIVGDHSLSLGLAGLGHGKNYKHGGFQLHPDRILVPYAGYLWAFHPDWSFHVEYMTFLNFIQQAENSLAELSFLSYGFRGHGQYVFGELGFAAPLDEFFVRHYWKYFPLGFPYFSIGFKN